MKRSWDGKEPGEGQIGNWALGRSVHQKGNDGVPVRVVPWECPYPPEQVPQSGEMFAWESNSYEVRGVPYLEGREWHIRAWNIDLKHGTFFAVDSIPKLPSPTITIGGKTYDEAAVIERCKELEEL